MTARNPRPYADPYVAGAGLGLVLLAAFVFAGRGLGASGAFASSAAGVVAAAAPQRAAANAYFARYLAGEGAWREWLLFELAGVAIGGFVSALLARRVQLEIVRGPNASRASPRPARSSAKPNAIPIATARASSFIATPSSRAARSNTPPRTRPR